MARVLLLLAITAALWAWAPAVAPPCNGVMQMLTPCIAYLTDRAPNPGEACCGGVKILRDQVKTRQDTVAVCKCLKNVADRFPVVDYLHANKLPQLCGVQLNFTFNSKTNCDEIPGFENYMF